MNLFNKTLNDINCLLTGATVYNFEECYNKADMLLARDDSLSVAEYLHAKDQLKKWLSSEREIARLVSCLKEGV